MGYQFVHLESYSRKADAKGRSTHFIFDELERYYRIRAMIGAADVVQQTPDMNWFVFISVRQAGNWDEFREKPRPVDLVVFDDIRPSQPVVNFQFVLAASRGVVIKIAALIVAARVDSVGVFLRFP